MDRIGLCLGMGLDLPGPHVVLFQELLDYRWFWQLCSFMLVNGADVPRECGCGCVTVCGMPICVQTVCVYGGRDLLQCVVCVNRSGMCGVCNV